MKRMQKALVITHEGDGSSSVDHLNSFLESGWRVTHLAPMGGAGQANAQTFQFAAIVIIEQTARTETDVEIALEAEVEEVEGNGTPEDPANEGRARPPNGE